MFDPSTQQIHWDSPRMAMRNTKPTISTTNTFQRNTISIVDQQLTSATQTLTSIQQIIDGDLCTEQQLHKIRSKNYSSSGRSMLTAEQISIRFKYASVSLSTVTTIQQSSRYVTCFTTNEMTSYVRRTQSFGSVRVQTL
jgi:hypothetical protein